MSSKLDMSFQLLIPKVKEFQDCGRPSRVAIISSFTSTNSLIPCTSFLFWGSLRTTMTQFHPFSFSFSYFILKDMYLTNVLHSKQFGEAFIDLFCIIYIRYVK